MVSSVSLGSSALSTLFGGTTSTTTGVDSSLLTAWAAAKAGIGGDVVEVGADPNAPTPPWTPGYTPGDGALASAALSGKAFFDPKAALYADLSMGDDYRQLFAIYQGVRSLSAVADLATATDISKSQLAKTNATFTRGVAELQAYLASAQFDGVNVAGGDRVDSATSTLGIAKATNEYVTGVIVKGSLTSLVPALPKDATFDVVATSASGAEKRVAIDLSQMGSIPRSLGNVVSFINQRLAAGGVTTRIEAVNQAPKTQKVKVGNQTVERAYTGQQQWALKVKAGSGESVSFAAANAKPAFYLSGDNLGVARLIKLEDTDGAPGQPHWVARPEATNDPIGALLAGGFIGAGAPYQSAPASSTEKLTGGLVSDAATDSATETLLRAAGEAVLNVTLADGRKMTLSTGWRSDDLEQWRVRSGETQDQGIVDDLAERLTQLLHEQGIAAGVDSWTAGGKSGLSLYTGDGVSIDSLTISGRDISLSDGRDPTGGYVGGLRAGVYARRFEVAATDNAADLYVDNQTFTFTTASGTRSITIDGGEDGVDAATLATKLNDKLRSKNVNAAAELVDDGNGGLTLRINAGHDVTAVEATLNGDAKIEGVLQAPGAWANGGLPVSSTGHPYGDALRTYTNTGASPLLSETGALSVQIVVATGAGDKTISVSVSAQERLDNPDAAPGEWNALFQERLDAALNAAGVYVDSVGSDLGNFVIAEGSGQRLASVTVNGNAVTYAADTPAFAVGGAFDAQRSFTTAQAGASTSVDEQALIDNPTVSITFDSAWGTRTISASLEPGDPRSFDAAALRLNEALAAAGYDVGVAAVALSGGGTGFRAVTGSSNTIARVSSVGVGADSVGATLDPIDAASHADDPVGALSVADRASRNAAVVATDAFGGTSPYQSPAVGTSGWFAGRDFDVQLGSGAKVLASRATAAGPDGSVYVLADISTDPVNQPLSGTRDVALLKYDSAGKLIYSRTLGAADEAQGFALAVAADGRVAVAGQVTGGLAGVSGAAGAGDSYVTMYNADGKELWTQRRGANQDDSVRQLAFAANGTLIVSGVTSSAMQGQTAKGGQDAYIRGYSASGVALFTLQYGTSGTDTAGALLVRDGGGGAIEIFAGGVESNRGVVRSFTYTSGAGLSVGASRDIGAFLGGSITSLAHDGTSLYVGGGIGADRLTVGNTARAGVSGQDGFVARIDDDLVSTVLDRATYIGSSADDKVTGLALVNGDMYALGQGNGVIAGVGAANMTRSFLTRLDDNGDIAWARSFAGAGGPLTAQSGLAVSAQGASVLDRLGLPNGAVEVDDATALIQRAALRAGDQFTISANDGSTRRITISATETLQTLTRKIGSAIGSAGTARLVTESNVQRIEITPRAGAQIYLGEGPAGKDALAGLGLPSGVIAVNTKARGAIRTFGLGLNTSELSLTDKDAIKQTKAVLAAALSIIRQAYEALANPNAKELTPEEQARQTRSNSGSAPEYLTQQIANYKAALTRLGG